MVEEYHDNILHVMVDCKTGNSHIDKAIEQMIVGYVNLVVYSFRTNQIPKLIDQVHEIAEGFKDDACIS